MKNKIWIKSINIILATAMLLGNAPAGWALRTMDAKTAKTNVDERIRKDLGRTDSWNPDAVWWDDTGGNEDPGDGSWFGGATPDDRDERGAASSAGPTLEQAINDYRDRITTRVSSEIKAQDAEAYREESAMLMNSVERLTQDDRQALMLILISSLDLIKPHNSQAGAEDRFISLGKWVFEETIILANKFGGLSSEDISGLTDEINAWIPDRYKNELKQALRLRPMTGGSQENQPPISPEERMARIAESDATVFNAAAGFANVISPLKNLADAKAALVIGAKDIFENAGSLSLLRATKGIHSDLKVIAWAKDIEEVRKLKAIGLAEAVDYISDEKFVGLIQNLNNQGIPVGRIAFISSDLELQDIASDDLKYAARLFGEKVITDMIMKVKISELGNKLVNNMPLVFARALAELFPEALQEEYVKFLEANIKGKVSEEDYGKLANLGEHLTTVPLVTETREEVLKALKLYEEQI